MGGIDKIYGNKAQWNELKAWLKKNKHYYLRYLYFEPKDGEDNMPICNFSPESDRWMYFYCDIAWVRKHICQQYNLHDYEEIEKKELIEKLVELRTIWPYELHSAAFADPVECIASMIETLSENLKKINQDVKIKDNLKRLLK